MKKLFINKEVIITKEGEKLATLNDVENYMCCYGDLVEGIYQIKEGIIEVMAEDDDYEIVLIKNRSVNNNEKTIAS